MSGKYTAYSEYKKTSLEWLDFAPKHWYGPISIKNISSLKGRLGWQGLKAEEYKEEGPYVVSSAHFKDQQIQWDSCPRVSFERYKLDSNIQLAEGDILLMKDGAAMGKLAFVDQLPGPACLNSHLLLFRPMKKKRGSCYTPRFMYYLMQTEFFQGYIKINGTGATFLGISQEAIGNYKLVLPPIAEQLAIESFLDHETAKIDTLIDRQQQLIKLLREKRQAVISHAVTRGLNPDVKMKDSVVEWLGEVPEHWRFVRARYLFKKEERLPSPTDEVITAYRDGQVCLRSKRRAEGYTMAVLEHGYQKILPGDLVIHGMDAFAGAIGVSEDEGKATPEYVVLSPRSKDVCPAFYAHILRLMALRNYIYVICPSVRERAPRFRFSKLQDVFLPVPPIDEQYEAMIRIEKNNDLADRLLDKISNQIQLLEEHRTALISAAVTGKIDVRNWQPAQTEITMEASAGVVSTSFV